MLAMSLKLKRCAFSNGYNTTYNYLSAERAYEIVENNAEYIIGCLRKNRIRFKLQCGIEDVVEITP